MLRFYGLKPWELEEMSFADVNRLWQAITILEARELLWQLRVAAFPTTKPQKAEKLESELKGKAYPFGEERELTWEDMAKELGQSGLRAEDVARREPDRNRNQNGGRLIPKGVGRSRK